MAGIKRTLIVDAGNSHIKAGILEAENLLEVNVIDLDNASELRQYQSFADYAIISSVSVDANELAKLLQPMPCLLFNAKTKLPFINAYETPDTIGVDRLAAVAGAAARFPNQNVLAIDCGTCITYDLLTADNIYQGGAISAGLRMRLQAMHTFTQRLPLPEFSVPQHFTAKNTNDCLLAGAFFGVADEINTRVARYEAQFPDIKILICGGDSALLEKHLKNNIFAAPNLVLEGLNQILYFNVN